MENTDKTTSNIEILNDIRLQLLEQSLLSDEQKLELNIKLRFGSSNQSFK